MSVISGDMDPRGPKWYDDDREILKKLGYDIAAPDDSGNQYAAAIDTVGLEYLKLHLNDPDAALEAIPTYLRRFGTANRNAGILSELTAEQFGLIINIASRQYSTLDEGRMHFLLRQVCGYLNNKNSMNVGGFTAQLRNPELLRDLVAHWEVINWPFDRDYARFLQGNADWDSIRDNIDLNANNPAIFAITIPEASTDPLIRARFRDTYPDLSQKGIEIIAAGLYNKGAHHEILLEEMPTMAHRYKSWETTIYEGLAGYGEEYRHEIVATITEEKWHIFEDTDLTFQQMLDKVRHTSFSLDENGLLVRGTR